MSVQLNRPLELPYISMRRTGGLAAPHDEHNLAFPENMCTRAGDHCVMDANL